MDSVDIASSKSAQLKEEAAEPENGSIDREPSVARARYEQSFPARWQQGGQATSDMRTVYTSTMDRTHDATTANETTKEESTYSYESTRDWAVFFKEIDGRMFSSQSSPYSLPSGKHFKPFFHSPDHRFEANPCHLRRDRVLEIVRPPLFRTWEVVTESFL
jgi:hypothetical protein